MAPDDPQVRHFLNRSMNLRVATISPKQTPHITPLRFVTDGRALYSLTKAASPTVRHIRARPGVVLLFDAEQKGPTGPVLRIRADAAIRTEPRLKRWYERRAATKYFLRPGGIWNMLAHWRRVPTWARGRRRATADNTALVEFLPRTAEFVDRPS